jgi:Domain of unknown function (DUF4384)
LYKLVKIIPAIFLAPLLANGLCAQTSGLSARDLYYEVDGASHLGIRYNLIKVDPATRKAQAVDPDQNFKEGDCFAVEFTPNQGGQIYVVNLGSSGAWQFLMPSPEMPSEASAVQANTPVRIPREFCFRLDSRRGVETLIIAVEENQNGLQAATRRTIEQVREWQREQIVGRDITMQKIADPEPGQEAPNTVYAVQIGGNKSGHVALEIKIRHE